MGIDYWLVHVKYTIPPAIVLTLLYRPLFGWRDAYRILFLVIVSSCIVFWLAIARLTLQIAVVSTIPWDSYLVRSRIWTYPPSAILGPTLFDIPFEEVFFFFIQTYDVSLFFLLVNRPTFYPAFLPDRNESRGIPKFGPLMRNVGYLGHLSLFAATLHSFRALAEGGEGTYMALIVVWAFPFLLLLWSLSHSFILRIPISNVALPIVIPTAYLWIVDTFALKRGTWVIENGSKYGVYLWDGLDIEEAFFFLVTNCLIVFGQIAFEHAVTVIDSLPEAFPKQSMFTSPALAIRAITMSSEGYDANRILALSQAIHRLQKKSRSFFLASSTFEGRLRIDLVLLYSFCRVADDLVDAAPTKKEAKEWVLKLRKFLDLSYAEGDPTKKDEAVLLFVNHNFPSSVRLSLLHLPVDYLSKEPLYDLLKGFDIDLQFGFGGQRSRAKSWPIENDRDLEEYGLYVAGTVAQLCLDLVFHHHGEGISHDKKVELKAAAADMGIALQTVNVARDIQVDADINRVYIPSQWLKDENLTPEMVLENPRAPTMEKMRSRLLDKAFSFYRSSRPAIEGLPREARGPIRVAIESYMEIGRVLRNEQFKVKAGKATVPLTRRILVAWKALNRKGT